MACRMSCTPCMQPGQTGTLNSACKTQNSRRRHVGCVRGRVCCVCVYAWLCVCHVCVCVRERTGVCCVRELQYWIHLSKQGEKLLEVDLTNDYVSNIGVSSPACFAPLKYIFMHVLVSNHNSQAFSWPQSSISSFL